MGARRTWTDADLADAVRLSRSYSEVVTKLGLNQGGGTHQHIKLHMRRMGLEFDHRDSHAWMRDPGAKTGGRPMPLSEVLVRNSTYTSSGRLRGRLIRAGLKEARCEMCGLTEWRGEAIQLELDHIDGNRSNNMLSNLRMLCPNCHAQTETWCKQKPT
jgi:HNH endonuclease